MASVLRKCVFLSVVCLPVGKFDGEKLKVFFCCPFSALRSNHGICVSEKINANKQVQEKEPLLTFTKDGEVSGKLRSFYFSISLWRFCNLDSGSVYILFSLIS